MTRFLTTASTAIALAIGLGTAPAHAQLLGGGIGGAIAAPMGTIGGAGDIGVSRIERGVSTSASGSATATRTVRAPAPRSINANGAANATAAVPTKPLANTRTGISTATSKVSTATTRVSDATSRVSTATSQLSVETPQLAVPGGTVVIPDVASAVVIPAVPNVEIRRAAIIEAGIAPIVYSDVPAYVERQYVVLKDELRGTGVTVIKRGEQIVLELPSDVNFAFDKYNIQPRFYGVLSAVSRTLAKYPATYVDVNGHTDAIGSYSYNQLLSERRADAVADFLVSRNVNGARLHVQGFGKTEPIDSNATVQGRAANRRVEIILTPYAA